MSLDQTVVRLVEVAGGRACGPGVVVVLAEVAIRVVHLLLGQRKPGLDQPGDRRKALGRSQPVTGDPLPTEGVRVGRCVVGRVVVHVAGKRGDRLAEAAFQLDHELRRVIDAKLRIAPTPVPLDDPVRFRLDRRLMVHVGRGQEDVVKVGAVAAVLERCELLCDAGERFLVVAVDDRPSDAVLPGPIEQDLAFSVRPDPPENVRHVVMGVAVFAARPPALTAVDHIAATGQRPNLGNGPGNRGIVSDVKEREIETELIVQMPSRPIRGPAKLLQSMPVGMHAAIGRHHGRLAGLDVIVDQFAVP